MTIGRIEIDFALRDDDDLTQILDTIGDMVSPFLDPHDEDGNCSRWVQIAAFEDVDDEYELGFDEQEIERPLVDALDDMAGEFRANSQWN